MLCKYECLKVSWYKRGEERGGLTFGRFGAKLRLFLPIVNSLDRIFSGEKFFTSLRIIALKRHVGCINFAM